MAFDVALHFGTLIAVAAFFWRDWVSIIHDSRFLIQGCLKDKKKNETNKEPSTRSDYPSTMLWLLVLSTIPGAVIGYFLSDLAETAFRNPLLIACMLIFFGALLFFFDLRSKKNKTMKNLSLGDVLLIGFVQALAIVPGVSRSGITITAGLARGLDRKTAARFSFLLSTPIIFGAALFQAKDFFGSSIGVAEIAGITTSAISGYLAIAWLIKFVEKASYKVFFWYRLALGLLIISVVLLAR